MATLTAILRAATEQGLIVIVVSDAAPDAALQQSLGKRLVVIDESDASAAVKNLRQLGVGAAEEATGGEGI